MEPKRHPDRVNDVEGEHYRFAKKVRTLTLSERFYIGEIAGRYLTHVDNAKQLMDALTLERNALLGMLEHDAGIKKLIDSTT